MQFAKLKALAHKLGYGHISIEFLTELRDVIPEYEKFMGDMRELLAPADATEGEDNADRS